MKMLQCIELIDLFGKNLNFKHNYNQKYKNTVGGILTIFYCLLSLSIYVYYFNYYIERKESRVTYQALKYPEPPEINLTKLNYNINLNLELFDQNKRWIRKSIDEILEIFHVWAHFFQGDTIKVEKCSNLTFVNNPGNLFDKCLALEFDNNSQNLTKEGIAFGINLKNQTKFEEDFPGYSLFILAFFNDISISLGDNDKPLHDLNRENLQTIEYDDMMNYSLNIEVKYGVTEVETDFSWFFESNIQLLQKLNIFEITEKRLTTNGVIYAFGLTIGYEGHSYKKSFQKFSEFLANASSLSSMTFLFFHLLSMSYKNISLEINTLNSIFQYNLINKKMPSLNNVSAREKIVINDNMTPNSTKTKIFLNKTNFNLRKSQKPSLNNIKPKTKFDQCRTTILLFNFCYRKKSKLYSDYLVGSSILNYYLEYDNFLLKMIELDFLKYLLLNKHQLELFKFVNLDYLLNNSPDEFMTLLKNLNKNSLIGNHEKHRNNENLGDNQNFKNLIEKSAHNKIDKKLIRSLGYVDLK